MKKKRKNTTKCIWTKTYTLNFIGIFLFKIPHISIHSALWCCDGVLDRGNCIWGFGFSARIEHDRRTHRCIHIALERVFAMQGEIYLHAFFIRPIESITYFTTKYFIIQNIFSNHEKYKKRGKDISPYPLSIDFLHIDEFMKSATDPWTPKTHTETGGLAAPARPGPVPPRTDNMHCNAIMHNNNKKMQRDEVIKCGWIRIWPIDCRENCRKEIRKKRNNNYTIYEMNAHNLCVQINILLCLHLAVSFRVHFYWVSMGPWVVYHLRMEMEKKEAKIALEHLSDELNCNESKVMHA